MEFNKKEIRMQKPEEENPNLDFYLDRADPEAIRFDGFDYAIIGTDHKNLLVYDHERMVECCVVDDEMSVDEAIEYIDYNVIGINAGDGFTIIFSDEKIL